MSRQAVSADVIPNSAVGIFSPKQKEQRQKQLIRWLACKFRSLYFAHLATLNPAIVKKISFLKTLQRLNPK
jgi:hypothetical protein